MKELYKRAIERTAFYACAAWWFPPTVKMRNKANTIQRVALLAMTKCYKTVPTSALQILAGLIPLDIKLDQESAIQRTKRGWSDFSFENLNFSSKKLSDFPEHKWYTHPAWIKTCEWNDRLPTNKNYEVFTDGSKNDEGTGVGFCVYWNGTLKSEYSYKLDQNCSVYQAETQAMKSALQWLKDHKYKAHLHTDSQAVLKSLAKFDILNSEIIKVKKLAFITKVKLHWIRGHRGYRGNEKADELDKKGISSTERINCKIPLRSIVRKTKEQVLILWQRRWQEEETGRSTFKILPKISERRHFNDFFVNQILSNHRAFPSYFNRFKIKNPPSRCPCGLDTADALHMILDCPSLDSKRQELFPQTLNFDLLCKLMLLEKGRIQLSKLMEYIYSNKNIIYV
ncbi:uncharacterized protein LOC118192494 [Stegodyphus dumicola]|uniref:uncharacterized protein LOC118192494 n=1 Tax=Stegodyphus dumicola TaxID=202533 RepID=UPI0015ABB65D|nr:uncharacterized protein LOC118192494 [Stegodyphus dumicola]